METIPQVAAALLILCFLGGCASTGNNTQYSNVTEPYIEGTTTLKRLHEIPDLENQPIITIAVYEFTDQTGQRKPNPNFSQ